MTATLHSRETENGRVYDWKDEVFPSVTQIIKDGLAKPGLVNWAARTVAKDVADNMEHLITLKTKKSIQEYLMDRFNGSRDMSAANVGTLVHGHADDIAQGRDADVYTEEVIPFMSSFDQFLEDWNPQYLYSEAFVFSRTYGYGGTLDAIVRINGVNYVLDIKTGNNVWPEVGLQLSAYARADCIGGKSGEESELPVLHPKQGLVLHLRPERYTLRPVRISDEVFNGFLACLDMHHYQKYTQHYIIGEAWKKEKADEGSNHRKP